MVWLLDSFLFSYCHIAMSTEDLNNVLNTRSIVNTVLLKKYLMCSPFLPFPLPFYQDDRSSDIPSDVHLLKSLLFGKEKVKKAGIERKKYLNINNNIIRDLYNNKRNNNEWTGTSVENWRWKFAIQFIFPTSWSETIMLLLISFDPISLLWSFLASSSLVLRPRSFGLAPSSSLFRPRSFFQAQFSSCLLCNKIYYFQIAYWAHECNHLV